MAMRNENDIKVVPIRCKGCGEEIGLAPDFVAEPPVFWCSEECYRAHGVGDYANSHSGEFRRYNSEKPGSFEVKVWLFDHELSAVVGALREFKKSHEGYKGYCTFLGNLENKFSTTLSKLLKLELEDKKKNLQGVPRRLARDMEKEGKK